MWLSFVALFCVCRVGCYVYCFVCHVLFMVCCNLLNVCGRVVVLFHGDVLCVHQGCLGRIIVVSRVLVCIMACVC